ncbi:purine-cytosine permease family protein [Crateriforma spongiae]|uniref:purine-cytosine permease family protein n=1 Tax=Crateriforma spongiae TaxID=2724528 RepID=UPI0014452EED
MSVATPSPPRAVANLTPEQMPVPDEQLHSWPHFLGLYAGEHVAATEFVIGATFVALGATTQDILWGLLIGNVLAIASWTLITAPIAVQTRLSLYTYLHKIAGDRMADLYNGANVLIFTVISAAMITVSSTAVRLLFGIPAQLQWFPTSGLFVLVVLGVGVIVVLIAMYGFNAVAEFSSICGPWLVVMFTCGALVLMPALAESVLGRTELMGMNDFITIGDHSIWTGTAADGSPGIGLWEVIGFAWAANTITHFGLIDMALLRYAKRSIYGLCTSAGMLFGHYVAWIAAGIMGAGTAALVQKSIAELDPGDVAYQALGLSGYVIVIVAGWTTANANLYRAGLAAQAIFHHHSRRKVTLTVGCVTVLIACFPFVFSKMLPLLTYAGLLVVPVGGIVFAEHFLFPILGWTRYWSKYRDLETSVPAIASWAAGLVFGFGMNAANVMSFFYLFLPTWAFTIVVYCVLARFYGAADSYEDQIQQEQNDMAAIRQWQQEQAAIHHHVPLPKSTPTKVLRTVAWLCLLITMILALRVMFASPDMSVYESHVTDFHRWGFLMTVGYFGTAYAALRIEKARNLNLSQEVKAS